MSILAVSNRDNAENVLTHIIIDAIGRHHGGNVTEMKRLNNQEKGKVNFIADGIYIEGKPTIVLCSSVFYFRIPCGEWRDRLEKVKAAGYNCIDIYFPWNFHEMEEGRWDFEGQKDVEAYLKLAAELGLWVIARPGPYICSEWDMGGLPAYLLSKEDLVLREYNEPYLEYVKKWYEKIMPIIVKYQIGKQGTVIVVQIENELDFYDCRQIEPYIARLRDLTLEAGIEVPIVACSGQCDLVRAGGLVEGVIPTMNFYPELQEKSLEDRIHHYVEVFREQDLPFCITETSPNHVILRREFIAGAKFIAPYNQVSGTNFGFTPSVNNWGSPLAYMPHDYNLKGMLNPQGEYTTEYGEALLFSGLIHSFMDSLGTSRSYEEKELNITGDCKLSNGVFRTLQLSKGGKLAAVANVDDRDGKVQLIYDGKSRPSYSDFTVKALTCPIIPFDIPFSEFGMSSEDGKLAYSTAEIAHVHKKDDTTYLLFYTDNKAEIAFCFEGTVRVITDCMEFYKEDNLNILTFESDQAAHADIIFISGKRLCVYGVSRENAVKQCLDHNFAWELDLNVEAAITEELFQEEKKLLLDTLNHMTYRKHAVEEMGQALSGQSSVDRQGCYAMEDMGYYRGYGWYEGEVSLQPNQNNLGYMVYQGMDVVHLYRNDKYVDSYIGDGGHRFIEEPESITSGNVKLGVRCEIWGHSNFSDSRLLSMDLRSKKGIKGLSVVAYREDITENWCYCKDELSSNSVKLLSNDDIFRPLIGFATYNNPDQPQIGVYKKRIKLHQDCDALMLELKDFHSFAKVYVNGSYVKSVQPFDTTVTLDHVCGKEEMELAVYLEQKTIQESIKARLYLYEGKHVTELCCCGADEEKLTLYTSTLGECLSCEEDLNLMHKVTFRTGEVTILSGDFTIEESFKLSLRLKIIGKDAKVLVLLNGIMLGRVWLPSEHIRPFYKGGDETVLFLPKSMMKEVNRLDFLVEGMQGEPYIEKLEYEIISSR